MGRQRTQLHLTPAQTVRLERLLATTRDARMRERLQFAVQAGAGRDTLEELAVAFGRSRSTIQNWLAKFAAGGLDGLLRRDTPPGMESPLAGKVIQQQLRSGIKSGRWQSAGEIAAWLHQKHGIERSRKSIYYWMLKSKGNKKSRNSRS